jgi:peptide alpha-N-acetyltransferase
MAKDQSLPSKEHAVFRSIVKFYETKQYKKGIKAADSILKKFPDHGETLCMKGLTLSSLDKKEEAYDLVRLGLKKDIRSHVCWHVYGLLYRQDRDYFEAIKCYRQALRIDTENLQILRDLSLLQIHRRDLAGFAETRRKLLQVKPNNRLNWIAYAVSEHLRENYEFAWTCIENYENTFKDENVTDYEHSETYLYKASIMEEAGKLEEALECLDTNEKQIVDKIGMLEQKGKLLMFLGKYDECKEVFKRLIDFNKEHHIYYLSYLASHTEFHKFFPPLPYPGIEAGDIPKNIVAFPQSMHPQATPIYGWLSPDRGSGPKPRITVGKRTVKARADTCAPTAPLSDEDAEKLCGWFDALQAEYPKAEAPQRLLLYFLEGDRFSNRLDQYLRPRIRKGIPSIFRTLKPLYSQEGKSALIEKLLEQYLECLAKEESFFDACPAEGTDEEAPSSLLFTYLMAAEHFDFVGETSRALELADLAMKHTPTFVEIYLCKARIYKHAGDLQKSTELFDEVRNMDLADRYLNCQAVKAMLRVDDVEQAMDKALLFSRDPETQTGVGPLRAGNLHDMQAMWYECAVGRSYTRQKNYGKALKLYEETFRHFQDISEDQFDFHNYCLRKCTLRTYVEMLRMQEKLYAHKFFRRSAKDAIKIRLKLYDQQVSGEADAAAKEEEAKEAEMSASDKKKAKHAAKRAKKADEPKKAATGAAAQGKGKKVAEDPDGNKLLEKDHMEEAMKLLKTLVRHCDGDTATHKLQYEVLRRQSKWLPCLQAIVRLWKLCGQDATHFKLVEALAHFCYVADLESAETPAVVREVILEEIAPVLSCENLANIADIKVKASPIIDKVVSRMKGTHSLPVVEVLAGIKCMKHAGRDPKVFLSSWRPEGAFCLKDCKKMLHYLTEEFGADSDVRNTFKARCLEVFPLFVVA